MVLRGSTTGSKSIDPVIETVSIGKVGPEHLQWFCCKQILLSCEMKNAIDRIVTSEDFDKIFIYSQFSHATYE